jgi:hypothetical protein
MEEQSLIMSEINDLKYRNQQYLLSLQLDMFQILFGQLRAVNEHQKTSLGKVMKQVNVASDRFPGISSTDNDMIDKAIRQLKRRSTDFNGNSMANSKPTLLKSPSDTIPEEKTSSSEISKLSDPSSSQSLTQKKHPTPDSVSSQSLLSDQTSSQSLAQKKLPTPDSVSSQSLLSDQTSSQSLAQKKLPTPGTLSAPSLEQTHSQTSTTLSSPSLEQNRPQGSDIVSSHSLERNQPQTPDTVSSQPLEQAPHTDQYLVTPPTNSRYRPRFSSLVKDNEEVVKEPHPPKAVSPIVTPPTEVKRDSSFEEQEQEKPKVPRKVRFTDPVNPIVSIPDTPTSVVQRHLFRNRMTSLGRSSFHESSQPIMPQPVISPDLHRPTVYFPPQADVESLKGSIHDSERKDESIRKIDALGTIVYDYTARSVKELSVTKVFTMQKLI